MQLSGGAGMGFIRGRVHRYRGFQLSRSQKLSGPLLHPTDGLIEYTDSPKRSGCKRAVQIADKSGYKDRPSSRHAICWPENRISGWFHQFGRGSLDYAQDILAVDDSLVVAGYTSSDAFLYWLTPPDAF